MKGSKKKLLFLGLAIMPIESDEEIDSAKENNNE